MPEVKYELNLNDNLSGKVDHATGSVEKLEKHLSSVKEIALGVAGGLGIGFGALQFVQFISEGREQVEKLHLAEAQLQNTMENMGTYSKKAFEESLDKAIEFSKGIRYSRSEVVELQAQLGLVGNIGKAEMDKMVIASADMSTKFNLGLTEAGNLLAKAVNNPEMARRLGMALKIDPEVMASIQELARNGKEAEARMQLLAIAEEKVGGAARAAFEADPMSRYNKSVGEIKLILGELAVELLKVLVPALEWLTKTIKDSIIWMREHKDLIIAIAAGIGAAVVIYETYLLIVNAVVIATKIWTAAQWLLNVALDANPISIVIIAIGALVTAIVYAWNHCKTFRAVIMGLWETLKEFARIVSDVFVGVGKVIHGVLHFDLKEMAEGARDATLAMYHAGTRIGDAFKKGFNESMTASNIISLVQPPDTKKPTTKPKTPATGVQEPKTKATGTKAITINVSIKDLIGTYNSNVTNIKENAKNLKDIVVEALTGAVNDFQIVAEH